MYIPHSTYKVWETEIETFLNVLFAPTLQIYKLFCIPLFPFLAETHVLFTPLEQFQSELIFMAGHNFS